MALILLIVFAGVFAVVTLGMLASAKPASDVVPAAREVRSKSSPADAIADVRKIVMFSAIPWINRLLLKMEVAPQLRLLIYQADLKWTVGGLLLMCVGAAVFPGYLVFLRTESTILACLLGAATSIAPIGFVLFKRSKRFAKFEEELPKTLDLMVSALRAGHSFNAALGLVAHESSEPIRSEFRICFEEQNYGLDLRHAMENLTTRVPLPDLRIATTAVLIQKETGGNLAEVLNNTSEVIRERSRLKRQVRVHTAHGRMTGWVIGSLPVVLLVALYIINPGLESLLWKREIGIKLLYG
jgi:tight adherence protein B